MYGLVQLPYHNTSLKNRSDLNFDLSMSFKGKSSGVVELSSCMTSISEIKSKILP